MNKRQTEILKMLYKDRNYQTFAKIADELNVSVKTVRNDISAIKEALAEAGAGEIETKPHVGVRLMSADGEIKNLKGQEEENREILFFILRSLFKNNRLTAQELAVHSLKTSWRKPQTGFPKTA